MNALLFRLLDWDPAQPQRIYLEWVALVVVAFLGALELRRRDALASFLSPVMQRRLTARASVGRTVARLAFVLLALVCGIGALMRPQVHGETETIASGQPSADVMFVLDVSRSMLAEDAPPNRLERAKAEIEQLVSARPADGDTVRRGGSRLEGHRVGLVAFAGRAVLVCPLTLDRSFFSTVLGTVDTRSAGRGGTRIGEAIKTALRGFPKESGAKLIVLITDGDDQDPYSEEAAKASRDAGVKIVVIGLGSEEGSKITLTDPITRAKTTLTEDGKPDGKPVISKLDGAALRKIALVTEGAYVPAGTSAVDLDAIMDSHITPIMRAASDAATREVPIERYPWLVLAAIAFVLASLSIGAGGAERRAR